LVSRAFYPAKQLRYKLRRCVHACTRDALQYDANEVIAMMHRLLPGSCLALALAACATHPPAAPAAGNSMPAAVPAWQPPAAAASAQQQPPIGCVGSTATRLPVAPGDCAGFGTVHSKNALDQTGQPWPNQALQMIDPTVRASGP